MPEAWWHGFEIRNFGKQWMFSWADFSVSLVECLWPACFCECGAPRSICLSAYGSEKESLRICLNDLHSSSWLDARVLLADVGCLKEFDPTMCWEFIQHIATSTYQPVEDLALVHFAPSNISRALKLHSTLQFTTLLTQGGVVPAWWDKVSQYISTTIIRYWALASFTLYSVVL